MDEFQELWLWFTSRHLEKKELGGFHIHAQGERCSSLRVELVRWNLSFAMENTF